MSLILEALRKSEAERQAASLPGLFTPAPAAGRRRRRPAWLWLLPLVLGAGLVLGWWAPRWLVEQDPPAAGPAPSGESPAAVDEATATSPVDSSPRAESLARQSTPADSGTSRSAPPAPTAAPSATPALKTSVPLDARPEQSPAAPPMAGVEPTSAPAPAQSTSADEAATPAPIELARLAQMPSVQRSLLPELKLSVHVFNEDPAARFAIVDGRRVREGDGLGSGVTLREIRRDGLMLEINGQSWLLDRPR